MFFDSQGVHIHYQQFGVGEPVLLIHGFTSNIANNWQTPGVVDLLAQDYAVAAFDCRGHGLSDKPHNPMHYGAAMVDDALRLLDRLKIGQAHIVGYSMGGRIAARLAVVHPERVRSVVIAGMGLDGTEDRTPAFVEEVSQSLEEGRGIGPLLTALTPLNRPAPSPERVRLFNETHMANQDGKALAACMRSGSALLCTKDELKSIRAPSLALIGEEDAIRARVEPMSRLVRDMKVAVVPRANHMTAYARPEFKRTLKEFLDANRGSAA